MSCRWGCWNLHGISGSWAGKAGPLMSVGNRSRWGTQGRWHSPETTMGSTFFNNHSKKLKFLREETWVPKWSWNHGSQGKKCYLAKVYSIKGFHVLICGIRLTDGGSTLGVKLITSQSQHASRAAPQSANLLINPHHFLAAWRVQDRSRTSQLRTCFTG